MGRGTHGEVQDGSVARGEVRDRSGDSSVGPGRDRGPLGRSGMGLGNLGEV